MKKHFFVIIEGPMGSGKTTIAEILHKQLKRTAFLGIDRIKFFLSDFTRNAEDNKLAANVVHTMVRSYLEQGCNILLPQGMWKKEYLEPYLALAKEFNVDVFMYQLEAPREVLMERIMERRKSKNLPELTEGRAERNIDTWEQNRYNLGKVINTVEYSPDEVAKIIMSDLESGSNIVH